MKFTEFSLHESLLQGIEGAGYVDCTPVQEQVLKSSLEGRDLYVQSQTGTGKTAAYLTSVIQELLTRGESAGKKALVMVPTRELAVQVQEEAQKLSKFTSLKCASFYGGVGYDKQVASLKKGVDIMIGTPGRVIDLNHGNQMDLSSVAFLVIDEADRMFDMGFYPDLRTLIKVLPSSEQRQTMLFSATLNSYVKNLAWEYTRNPAEITIAAENITVDEIAQELFHVSSDDKMKLLLGIISHEKPESLIVFCNTKKSCEIVAKRLKMNGFESEFIIGDLPQKKRLTIMDKFKAGAIKCLVATDVAARGIDVNDLAMVINYDLPNEAENYVHRIGRTARAGKSGKAFTFCSEQDVYSLPPIERYIEKSIPSCVADESMFAEDKSAGVYIKLDSYHEDYNDKSEFGRRRAAEYNRKNGNSDRRRSSKKGSGRYSSRNEEAKKEYKRDRRVYIDEDKLASMSTEERMKIYREKYASFASGSSSNKQKISTKKQGVAKKNSSVQKNASGKKNYSSKSAESKKTPQKKSVFARIKSFFGKK
ncbi:DEAD/DEAH box helicase [uncultured Treponema sp.]|uniref:DEAD/DEAH box helicase n=1 Tax=uncultured Treponema sp. TaxID=162155 RepID=UPI0025997359|nr:DEAD/DEAH box helicase [uncultured Treponema sp.]